LHNRRLSANRAEERPPRGLDKGKEHRKKGVSTVEKKKCATVKDQAQIKTALAQAGFEKKEGLEEKEARR